MFGSQANYRDISMLGDCQDSIFKLADLLGWRSELDTLINQPFN